MTSTLLCLASISAGLRNIHNSAKNAKGIVVVDGCPMQCGLKTLNKANFNPADPNQLPEYDGPGLQGERQKYIYCLSPDCGFLCPGNCCSSSCCCTPGSGDTIDILKAGQKLGYSDEQMQKQQKKEN